MKVAVVGAGMAGLACALALEAGGVGVMLYDKGRRAGGRIATRRVGELTFNHGAQFAAARDPGFAALLTRLEAEGVVGRWSAPDRFVGVPGMSALPAALAARLAAAPVTDRHVAFLHAEPDGWRVRHLPADAVRPGMVQDHGGALDGPFDAVLLALPAPQATGLLDAAGAGVDLSGVAIAPCRAVMAAFADRIEAPDFERRTDGPLAWIARENSRPGAAAGPDRWMLHASPAWSRAHVEDQSAQVATALLAAFGAIAEVPEPIHLSEHRWRYSMVETPLGAACVWDPARRIGLCGDWCIGPRVEAAWLSGTVLARSVLTATTRD